MKAKKIIITIIVIVLIIAIAAMVYFINHAHNIKKYTNAEEYTVKEQKIASVKSIVGEKEIENYKYTKGDTESLELVFIDQDKEATVEKYMAGIKETTPYIEMENVAENEKKFAIYTENRGELLTVETKTTDTGFILKIEVGPGAIQVQTEG